jgi:hypothetical protein
MTDQEIHDQVAPVMAKLERGEAQLHPHDAVWARVEAYAKARLASRDRSEPTKPDS